LDGPFPKLCPAVALSHQDGRHSAVALLLKAALIQVSDYGLLGASGFTIRYNDFIGSILKKLLSFFHLEHFIKTFVDATSPTF
jgi:hypothetical protein